PPGMPTPPAGSSNASVCGPSPPTAVTLRSVAPLLTWASAFKEVLDRYQMVFHTSQYSNTGEDLMATNCTSEDMAPDRKDRDQILSWVASALRSERLLTALHQTTGGTTEQ